MSSAPGWERVRQLFHEALDQPAEHRESFVRRAAGSDDDVRRELQSLLDAHAAAEGFLDVPSAGDRAAAERPYTFQTGARVGTFEIVSLLGAGGMGEVYRARDLQLGREVAIKVLPPSFAADKQRLARFERESRVLATLNHPNIGSIHSIAQIDGLHLLVLELVEGRTLAERLASGPCTVSEALQVARQLAEALEAAHERGIVHRDLKPANVKLSSSGRVVLLDFGLAKERLIDDSDASASPNDDPSTIAGLILGTCAYMSPEQARGHEVDKRTDIWAFGCILFELLTGRRTFRGGTPSDTIAAVLERDPDWQLLPEAVPASVRTLLARCLAKDVHRRLHDIADARIEIDEVLQCPETAAPPPSRGRHNATRFAVGAGLVLTCVAAGWWLRGLFVPAGETPRAVRSSWAMPDGLRLQSPAAVSPDGRQIAFTAAVDGSPPLLYIRPLNALEARAIPRTDGAEHPFWSPDSRAVAYFARGRLMRVTVDDGPPVDICSAANPRGGAWGRNGVIVFAPDSIYAGLSRVSTDGGAIEPATVLDAAQGENAHRWPAFLPDGVHFVYFVRSIRPERRGVYLGRIDRAAALPSTPLFRSEAEAVYAPLDEDGRGVLLAAAAGHIDVHPFDAKRLALNGDPTTIPLPVGGNTPRHAAMLSASAALISFVSSSVPYGDRLASSTREGDSRQIDRYRNIINWPRVSPDGTRLVSQRLDALTGSPDLWVEDLARGTRSRVNQEGTSGQLPVWSPDGTRLAFLAGPSAQPVLTIAAADGTGVLSTLPCPLVRCEPSDWSHDGRWLLATVLDPGTADVWMIPTVAGLDPRPVLTAPFTERDARFSSDGTLVAYVSEESGRPEISVRTLEKAPRHEVVSVGGGTQPVWSRRASELLFVDLEGALQSAAVRRTTDGRVGVASAIRLKVPLVGTGHYGTQYDVSPDGRRIYFLDRQPAEPLREIGLILGWRELLK